MPSLLACPSNRTIHTIQSLDKWNFDAFKMVNDNSPLQYITIYLFVRYGILEKFDIDMMTAQRFIAFVENGYALYDIPYHNKLHAAEVIQTAHYILSISGLRKSLSDMETFAFLFAAIIHDFGHEGLSNEFLIATDHEWAQVYNFRLPSENHRLSTAFRMLENEDSNILLNLKPEDYRHFRYLVINILLAKEVKFDKNETANSIDLILNSSGPNAIKVITLGLILKACDVSHYTKRWPYHRRWALLSMEECYAESDQLIKHGLEVNQMCNRFTTDVPKTQLEFIKSTVKPLYKIVSLILDYLPKDSSSLSEEEAIRKPWHKHIDKNVKKWKEQLDDEKKKRK